MARREVPNPVNAQAAAAQVQPMSGKDRAGIVGTDYDMMLTFALMRANGSADTDAFIRNRAAGH